MIRNNGRITKRENPTRKNNKQVMEKKRRARINTCLTDLKSLVLKGMKKEEADFSKLEKADILEMTVNYLNTRRSEQKNVGSCDQENLARYRAGFNECAKEAFRYIGTSPHVTCETRLRVMEHLATCLQTKSVTGLPNAKMKIARLHPPTIQIKQENLSPLIGYKPSPGNLDRTLRPILPCPHAGRISPQTDDTSTSGFFNTELVLKDIQNPSVHNNACRTNFKPANFKDESYNVIDNEGVHKPTLSPSDTMWRPW